WHGHGRFHLPLRLRVPLRARRAGPAGGGDLRTVDIVLLAMVALTGCRDRAADQRPPHHDAAVASARPTDAAPLVATRDAAAAGPPSTPIAPADVGLSGTYRGPGGAVTVRRPGGAAVELTVEAVGAT